MIWSIYCHIARQKWMKLSNRILSPRWLAILIHYIRTLNLFCNLNFWNQFYWVMLTKGFWLNSFLATAWDNELYGSILQDLTSIVPHLALVKNLEIPSWMGSLYGKIDQWPHKLSCQTATLSLQPIISKKPPTF